MNEIERRRQELLNRTKTIYNNQKQPPAIHPRYTGVYRSLYETQKKSTFVLRLAIAVVIFLLFFAVHYKSLNIGSVNSDIIIQEIQNNLFSKKFPLFVKGFEFFKNFRFFL